MVTRYDLHLHREWYNVFPTQAGIPAYPLTMQASILHDYPSPV